MLKYFACAASSSLLTLFLAGSAFAQPAAPPPEPSPAPSAAQPSSPLPPGPASAAPVVTTVEPVGPAVAPKPVQAPVKGLAVEFTSLRLMRDKGIITQAEYESALKDVGETAGMRAADSLTFLLGKLSTTFYGFVDADFIYDTTQSFGDLAGNAPVVRPGSYAANHARMSFSLRDARIGFRIRAPEYHGIRASAVVETDFFGPTLPIGSGQPYFGTEAGAINNPSLRLRIATLKLETPVIDLTVGQTWHLFGWQPNYISNTVQLPGLPGELFGRTPQIRLSKLVKGEAASFEIAVAASRPAQRDSGTPDLDGGIRFTVEKWRGTQTIYSVAKQVAPLSVAVTGTLHRILLPEFAAKPAPDKANEKLANGIAVDAFLPIIPTPKGKTGDSLSLNGEFVYGYGLSDRYTALVGGVSNPALPNPEMATPAPTYTPNIDPGPVAYDAAGKLHLVQWTTFNVGAQYYIHGLDGRLWIAGNYAQARSSNAAKEGAVLGDPERVWDKKEWFDVCLFGDPTPDVRFGLEFARTRDTYSRSTNADTKVATSYRGELSAILLF